MGAVDNHIHWHAANRKKSYHEDTKMTYYDNVYVIETPVPIFKEIITNKYVIFFYYSNVYPEVVVFKFDTGEYGHIFKININLDVSYFQNNNLSYDENYVNSKVEKLMELHLFK